MEVVAQNAGDYFYQKAKEANRDYLLIENNLRTRIQKTQFIATLPLILSALAALFLLYSRWTHGSIDLAELLTILLAVILFYQELSKLTRTSIADRELLCYAVDYFLLLDYPVRKAQAVAGTIRELEFCNANFDYGDKAILKNISLHFLRGQSYLIFGHNGAGKSTLITLLAGLQRVDSGLFRVNEFAESETMIWLRTALVSQDFPQVNLTLRESLAAPQADTEEINAALDAVGLGEIVSRLEEGLEAVVGQDIGFSHGQWQRFSIARLLLQKDRDIWILDEATSAIDALEEEGLIRLVKQAAQDKILIVITHRLGVAQHFDEVIHLEHGEVVGKGTHQALLEHDAHYRDLYDIQSKLYGRSKE